MSNLRGFLCGTPSEHCSGGKLITDQHLKSNKVHHSQKEAFDCYAKYLIKMGYVRKNSREFWKEGEHVLLIPKQHHFGGRLRAGKGDKNSKRLMPKKGRGLVY